MMTLSIYSFAACYALALLGDVLKVFRRTAITGIAPIVCMLIGWGLHTLFLWQRAGETRLPPLLSSMQDWVLVLAWLVVLLYLLIAVVDRSFRAGVIVLPMVLALIVLGSTSRPVTALPLDVSRSWLMLHVSMLVFGTAAVIGGLVLSMLFLWQHARMKHPRRGIDQVPLPSLERLERLNRWLLVIAVPLLTLGMGVGLGLGLQRPGRGMLWTDPLVMAGVIGWGGMLLLFAYVLGSRRPPARKAALLTVVSCGLLLITILATGLVTMVGEVPAMHGPDKATLR